MTGQPLTSPTTQRLEGVVRKVKNSYGFIAGYDGADYYLHWTAVRKDSPRDFRKLEVGDIVEFRPYLNGEARRAVEVISRN